MSKRKTIENGRAKAAFDYVQEVKNEDYADNYKSYIKNMVPYIKNNGLGNTLAFYNANKSNSEQGKAYKKIYDQLNKWLEEKGLIQGELLSEILSVETSEYRHITQETLAILNWWRRFVDGEIDLDE